jgi:PKD repeat protein
MAISSLDEGYEVGDLSVYPEEIDSTTELYAVRNNAETTLKNSLTFAGKTIVVEDATSFPSAGIIRVGPQIEEPTSPELIVYGSRTSTVFKDLQRGFAGSRQNFWCTGSLVANAVSAEPHNAVKDAIINIQQNLGLTTAEATSADETGPLNGILREMENKFLAPRPFFRATYLKGAPPLTVRFQNFTGSDPIRFLWDFGDGSSSIERNPTHIYQQEGIFTVTLTVITSTGGQGIATKTNYIEVSEENKLPFFYVQPLIGTSIETADELGGEPTSFEFVDQTDGEIVERFWIFDDGTDENQTDPNIHTTEHIYESPGSYDPSLIVVLSNSETRRVFFQDTLVVT